MSNRLQDLATEYVAVRAERSRLEKEAATIKEGREAELKGAILNEMSASGFKSVNLEGIGRLCSKDKTHYEIADINKLAAAMLKIMVENGRAGRMLSDGLLLQARPSKEGLDTMFDGVDNAEAAMDAFGVRRVSQPELSLTKN